MWPAVTSWVNPVYLSGLRHTDQHSHFDSQPSVRPIVRGDRGELQPLATALFMQTPWPQRPRCCSPEERQCVGPIASWMPLTTLQSLNHCCAFEREKREGGRDSLQLDWLLLVELLLRGGLYSAMDGWMGFWLEQLTDQLNVMKQIFQNYLRFHRSCSLSPFAVLLFIKFIVSPK